jgi:glycosyltransferase involved in cell wall biosynthesis
VLSDFLKKALPAPLHQPMRGVALFVMVPLRRRLRHTWRSGLKRRVRGKRNQLKRRVRDTRNRLWHLRGKLQRRLSRVWRRQLKQRLWPAIWRTHIWSRGKQPLLESNNQIHLIGALWSLHTGTSQRTLHLFDELKDHADVHLWTERLSILPEIRERYPVKRIVPERFRFPKTGTFVFVGTLSPIGPWHRYTYPRRIVLVHNSDKVTPRQFRRKLRQLSKGGRREVEVAYASELSKRSAGNYPGIVQASLIDLDRFAPSASKKTSDSSASAGFTVGRMSRPASLKHHPDDGALYRQLVEHGCRVRIMGPSPPLEAKLSGLESIELVPAYAQEAHLFLQGLDCFFYRTSENYLEPSGRVITEAMACGLPIVCHKRGGYTEWIEDGHNGFLFDTQQEALEIVLKLKEDPQLRERVGKEARRTAEELFSDAVRSEIVEFYLR